MKKLIITLKNGKKEIEKEYKIIKSDRNKNFEIIHTLYGKKTANETEMTNDGIEFKIVEVLTVKEIDKKVKDADIDEVSYSEEENKYYVYWSEWSEHVALENVTSNRKTIEKIAERNELEIIDADIC